MVCTCLEYLEKNYETSEQLMCVELSPLQNSSAFGLVRVANISYIMNLHLEKIVMTDFSSFVSTKLHV